jgi:hypothetical protein
MAKLLSKRSKLYGPPKKHRGTNKDRPLCAKVQGNEVVIRIGIDTLAFAFDHSDENRPWDHNRNEYVQQWKVTDPKQFAKDFVHELLTEEEDGSSNLSNFFDRICEDTANEGTIGIELCGASAFEGNLHPLTKG